MNLRHLAAAGAVAVVAVLGGAAAVPVAVAQPANVQDCDTARAAYDKVLAQLNARAEELGISAADRDRLRESVEAKGQNGVIDDQESAALLQDPVVQRVSTQFRASDLDLIKKVASAHNALLRCSDKGAGATTTTTPPTSTTTAPPRNSVPSSSTAPPESTDNSGDNNNGNDDTDTGTPPVGGIQTGHGGMADALAT